MPPRVHERTVLGDVLDDALADVAFAQIVQGLLLEGVALLLQQHAPRQNDVAALLVELDDLERELLADELVQVADGPQVHLGAGEEGFDADVHRQSTLDPGDDGAFYDLVLLAGPGNLLPHLEPVGLLLGKDAQPAVVLHGLHQHVDLVTYGNLHFAVALELVEGNLALALEADVDHGVVAGHVDDIATDDVTRFDLCPRKGLLEKGREVFDAVAVCLLRGCVLWAGHLV